MNSYERMQIELRNAADDFDRESLLELAGRWRVIAERNPFVAIGTENYNEWVYAHALADYYCVRKPTIQWGD